ncbi:MAG: PAS domain S-box protein, partial [Methylococcales bacterium]
MSSHDFQAATETSDPEDVEAKLLYGAYKRKPLSVLMSISVAIVLGGVLLQFLPTQFMQIWILAVIMIYSLGYLHWWLFQRTKPAVDQLKLWRRLFFLDALLAGGAWTVGPVLMIPNASGAELALLVCSLLSVCVIAMITVAEQQTAMRAFIAAALLPSALVLWFTGDSIERLVAVVLLFAMALITLVGHRFSLAMREQIQAQYHLQAILDTALDAVIVMDAQGRITDWSQCAKAVFGWSKHEVLGLILEDLIIPKPHREVYHQRVAMSLAAAEQQTGKRRMEGIARRRNGQEFPIELAITSLKTSFSRYFTCFISDITERQRAEEEQRISAIAFESQSCMIVTNPDAGILRVNQAFTRLTGYSAEEAVGRTPHILSSGRHDKNFFKDLWAHLVEKGHWQGEIWNRRKNGLIIAEWLNISAVTAPDGAITHYVGTYSDITENKDALAEIHRLAYYDPLTHLPNRRLLQDRLSQILATVARTGLHGAILFLDLDNFKTLNDTR